MGSRQGRKREVEVQRILFTLCISFFISYVCHLLLFWLHFVNLFWICVGGNTCIRPQRIPRKPKFWKYCAIQRTGYIDAAELCSGAWWTHVWSSCTVATVWQAVLCALLSHVPASPLRALPLWHGFGSFPGLWGEVAMMDGDVKMPDSVDVKPVCTFRIMLIYVRSPGPKIRECKYYNMDQETLRFVCCLKV